jgi:hypothetical protein
MLKPSLAAVLLALGGLTAATAHAADALKCDPPVLRADSATAATTRYSIHCAGAQHASVSPRVSFRGEIPAKSTPPYLIHADYAIDIRGDGALELGSTPREDQLASGTLIASTVSLVDLPEQLSARTVWDAASGVLSLEDTPGHWRLYRLSVFDDQDEKEQSLRDMGAASAPMTDGHTTMTIIFGKYYSRFAGRVAELPVIQAVLGNADDKAKVAVGESRIANEKAVQGALSQLDRAPSDITRAWALASRAQFLGLDDEVRYAEQKVAAFHPDLLDEFQRNVARIEPYTLPR